MRAIPGFRYLAWLTALSIAGLFTAGAFRFGLTAEPEQTGPLTLVFLSALGLASQLGLIAAPWALSQHWAVRIGVVGLMTPAAIVLVMAAWDGAQRLLSRNPMSPVAWAIYLVGALVYSLAYVQLAWRSFLHEHRR